jgi:hypothetical protein
MVEVSFEPLLIGIDAVSSIKFAGCPSLMYVATRAGQIFEVTINNATSAVRSSSSSISLSLTSPNTACRVLTFVACRWSKSGSSWT